LDNAEQFRKQLFNHRQVTQARSDQAGALTLAISSPFALLRAMVIICSASLELITLWRSSLMRSLVKND
jgi:hypothetical protein